MKKVIIEQDEQVISLEQITDEMIVGIEWDDGDKSFLIEEENGETLVIIFEEQYATRMSVKFSPSDYIKKVISDLSAQNVFVFDSPKELAQWLAE